MKVTLVSYRGNSVHIVLDSGESLTLPVSIEYGKYYHKDVIIPEDEFAVLKKASDTHLCIIKALLIVGRAAQSVRTLTDKLKKKKLIDEDAIKETVKYLLEKGYLDDTDYTRRFAASLVRRKSVGKRRIMAELFKKGIDKRIAESVISELNLDEDDLEQATALAEKKAASIKQKEKVRERVWRFLLSRGFSDRTIRKALASLKNDNSCEDSFE